jgi:dimethylamine monooxygenase subunit A
VKPVDLQQLPARLFGGDRYAFQFGMHRGDADWFDLAGSDPDALADRRHWLAATPERCLVWHPDAALVLQEACTLFSGQVPVGDTVEALAGMSAGWEPDFLLLRRSEAGEFRLVGGAVCFPSSWDVREKLGLDVTAIHDVVPTLNATLGAKIRTFLGRLPAEGVFERENWGLAAHGERNAHPERGMPRLTGAATVDTTWLRVEHQAFRALPRIGGILFVIRLTVHPLAEVLAVPGARELFVRQLASMPGEIAAYKGIAPAREALVREMGLEG